MPDLVRLLTHPRTWPTVMVVGDLIAACCYAKAQLWWHVVYWVAAAVLTTSVTYGMRG